MLNSSSKVLNHSFSEVSESTNNTSAAFPQLRSSRNSVSESAGEVLGNVKQRLEQTEQSKSRITVVVGVIRCCQSRMAQLSLSPAFAHCRKQAAVLTHGNLGTEVLNYVMSARNQTLNITCRA